MRLGSCKPAKKHEQDSEAFVTSLTSMFATHPLPSESPSLHSAKRLFGARATCVEWLLAVGMPDTWLEIPLFPGHSS